MKKFFKVFLAITALSLLTIIVVACGGKKSATVPEYTGMTIGGKSSLKSEKLLSEKEEMPSSLRDFVMNDIEVPDAENEGEGENVNDEKVEQEVKDSITVNAQTTQNEYYAMPNDTIEVHIHINNPDECAILLFRLNGVTYQTYQFKTGSNSTLIIVDYKLDDKSGFRELTIDNLKYVDNTDNLTKDCKMTGADTIKVLVQHTIIPSITITNAVATFNTFSAKAELKDPLNLLQPNSAKLAVYEGETLVKAFDLAVGNNEISLDNLSMGQDYAYYAVGAYDVCDGKGAKAYVFDEGKVSTAEGFSFELTGTTKNKAEFKVTKESEAAAFEKVILFDKENNPLKEVTTFAEAVAFDALSSNTAYHAALYYSFTRNNEKVVRSVPVDFDTLASEITISKFEIINDVVKPNEQINVSVEFNNPDNIRITAFILNGEAWEVKGGNQTTAAQLYFTAPDRKNETFEVVFEAIEYTFNGKKYVQKVDGDYVGLVQISDVLGMVSADFISEYSEPGVALQTSNVLIVFNNPSNYTISKVYIDNQQSALIPIQVSPTEYIVSPDWIYNSLNITKFSYLVGDKEVNIEERREIKLNALVGSPNVNKISTADQLLAITNVSDESSKNSGVIYQLQNDIDMTGKAWKPSKFYGVLDGNGYTIKNLQIADSSTEAKNFGMFTELAGMIVNLKLEAFYFNFEYNGGTGGVFAGRAWEGGLIQDCYAKDGTIIVKNGSYTQEGYYGEKGYKEGTLSYAGAGEIVNTVLSNVKVYVGSSLVTTTAVADAPVHNTENRMFENKSNETFEYREFDKFVMITGYKSDSQEITLPAKINDKKVMYINNFLTSSTAKIKRAVFEEGIEYARSIFNNCNTLESVVLPSTMTTIGDNLFSQCYQLKNVILPEGLVKIGNYAFGNCNQINDIELPNTLKSIGAEGFAWCGINTLFVPDSVTYVGPNALHLMENCVVVHQHESMVPAGWDPQFNGWSTDSNKTTVIYNDGTKKIMLSVNANFDREMKTLYNDKIDETPAFSIFDGSIEGWYLDKDFENAVTFPFVPENGGLTVIYGKVRRKVYVHYYQSLDAEYNYQLVSDYMPVTVTEPSISVQGYYVEGWYLDKALTQKIEFPWTINEVDRNKGNWYYIYPKLVQYDEQTEGDFTYYIDQNNNKILSGYSGTADEVDLSVLENLKGIANSAFTNTSVNKVIIPEGVTYIGDNAFSNIKSLKEVVLPSTLTSIGRRAFQNSGLTSITFPDSLISIGYESFGQCNSLQSVKLPKNLITIEGWAFNGCWALKSIDLPDGLKTIGEYGLANNGIKVLVIPESVETVGHCALQIENGVVVVPFAKNAKPAGWASDYSAFDGYDYAPKIVYSDNNQAIIILNINGDYDRSSIQTVVNGKLSSAPQISMYNDATIEGWYLDDEFTQEVEFPYEPSAGIHNIYAKVVGNLRVVFRASTSSQTWDVAKELNLKVPATIEYLEYEKTGKILEGWYFDAALTRKVTFPYEVTSSSVSYLYLYPKFDDVEELTQGLFTYYLNKDNKKVLTAYDGDENTVDLSVLEDLAVISAKAFQNNKDIYKVIIPEGVTYIGEYAFSGCTKLGAVVLPSTLKTIGRSAFSSTSALKQITIPEGVVEIGDQAFWESGLTSISLPSTLKTIGSSAFCNCWSLYGLVLPDGLETVGDYAFSSTRVKLIDVPASVTTAGQAAFRSESAILIVHFAKRERPAGWNEYFYTWGDSDSYAPEVVYDDGTKNVTYLVIPSDYGTDTKIKYNTGAVNSKPSVSAYNCNILGWYLDKEYTQEVTFPYVPTENGVHLLYAKVEYRVTVLAVYSDRGWNDVIAESYGKVELTKDAIDYCCSSNGNTYKCYLDKDYTQEVTADMFEEVEGVLTLTFTAVQNYPEKYLYFQLVEE